MLKVTLPVNDKQKQKLKKNALDFVNIDEEKKNDPKYKTELCKSFRDTNFCPYGNRCRFAHGKKELFNKNLDANKYKQKQCNSFKESGYCLYGSRCNFKHGEAKMDNINRSYYEYLLRISYMEEDINSLMNKPDYLYTPFVLNKETFFQKSSSQRYSKRLDVFANLTKNTDNSSTSVSSNDSFSPVKQNKSFSNISFLNNSNFFNNNNGGIGFSQKNLSVNNIQQNNNSPVNNFNFYGFDNFGTSNNNNSSNPLLSQIGFYPASFLNKTPAN